jgi:hypothetical protein
VQVAAMRELARNWATNYDWRKAEAKGNETHGVAFSSLASAATLGQKLIKRSLEIRKTGCSVHRQWG